MPGMPSTPSAVETGAALGIELAQARAVRTPHASASRLRQHDVALGVIRVVGRDDLADGAAYHHLADVDRLA